MVTSVPLGFCRADMLGDINVTFSHINVVGQEKLHIQKYRPLTIYLYNLQLWVSTFSHTCVRIVK